MFASTSSGGTSPASLEALLPDADIETAESGRATLAPVGGVQRKAAQTASGEERTSKSVLSCGQFLDKVSIDGMAKPRGKSVKSTVNYIQKSCQLGKNSWGLRSLNRSRSGRSPSISANITFLLSFPLSCHTFWRCQGEHFSRAPRPK